MVYVVAVDLPGLPGAKDLPDHQLAAEAGTFGHEGHELALFPAAVIFQQADHLLRELLFPFLGLVFQLPVHHFHEGGGQLVALRQHFQEGLVEPVLLFLAE